MPGKFRAGPGTLEDLTLAYDRTGRQARITGAGGRLWKQWTYATTNSAGFSRGKLLSAKRWNRGTLPSGSGTYTIPVTEDYTYSGRGGRLSDVTTTVGAGDPGNNTRPIFTSSYTYDVLGEVGSIGYPECSHDFCSEVSFPRTVSFDRTEGLLTGVPGYAPSIAYHANGLVSQVSHANGVTDHQQIAADGMARPSRLQTTGAEEDFDTGSYTYDGTGNVASMGPDTFVYDEVSRLVTAEITLGGSCGEQLVLSGDTVTGTESRSNCGEILAGPDYTVASSGDLTLTAGELVVLRDGFTVQDGGTLTAGVDGSLASTGEAQWAGSYDRFGNLTEQTTTAADGTEYVSGVFQCSRDRLVLRSDGRRISRTCGA